MSQTIRVAPALTTTIAAAVTVQTTLPVALLGVVFPMASAALGFGTAELGLVVSAYWVASSIVSLAAGPLFARVPPIAMTVVALALGMLSAVGTVAWAGSWTELASWAAVGGVANATAHPSSNALLVTAWGRRPPAIAFGIKQAAVPAASLLAGAMLPLVVDRFGWRAAFASGIILGPAIGAMLLAVGRRARADEPRARRPDRPIPRPLVARLLLVTTVTLLAAAASNSMTAFIIVGATERGIDPTLAGVLLVAASCVSIAVRLGAGLLADRGRLRVLVAVAALLGVGAVGLGLMAVDEPALYVVGSLLAFLGAFGWPGLVHYAVAVRFPSSPIRSTMLTQSGSYLGSAIGPTVFGLAFTAWGTSSGWLLMAGTIVAAALAALAAERWVRSEA